MNTLLAMSLQGSVMGAVILVIRAAAGTRIPSLFLVPCWYAVLLRLLVPFPTELPAPIEMVHLPNGQMESIPIGASSLNTTDGLLRGGMTALDNVAIPLWFRTVLDCFPWIWAAIAGLLLSLLIIAYIIVVQRFASASETCQPLIKEWLHSIALHRPLHVRESTCIDSPLTYGVVRPIILIPASFKNHVSDRQLILMLNHELEHIKHFDFITKEMTAVAICLHWFNPFVWVMRPYAICDLELACDQRVLSGLGRSDRARYARMLIDCCNDGSRSLFPSAGFGVSAIERRVTSILCHAPSRVLSGLFCLVLTVVLGGSVATAVALTPNNGPRYVVSNGTYSFELPHRWVGKVEVGVADSATYIHLIEHPNIWLLRLEVATEGDKLWQEEGTGCRRIQSIAMGDGRRLDVWAINYLGKTAGDSWATSYSSNPTYAGPEVEEAVIWLSTGGAYNADEVRLWPKVVVGDSDQISFDFYRAMFDGSIWIEDN